MKNPEKEQRNSLGSHSSFASHCFTNIGHIFSVLFPKNLAMKHVRRLISNANHAISLHTHTSLQTNDQKLWRYSPREFLPHLLLFRCFGSAIQERQYWHVQTSRKKSFKIKPKKDCFEQLTTIHTFSKKFRPKRQISIRV